MISNAYVRCASTLQKSIPDEMERSVLIDDRPETRQISTVVNEMKRVRGRVRFGACAVVANRDALVGMMRVFDAMAEECFRVTCTFRAANEAEVWLVSQKPRPVNRQASR